MFILSLNIERRFVKETFTENGGERVLRIRGWEQRFGTGIPAGLNCQALPGFLARPISWVTWVAISSMDLPAEEIIGTW